MQESGGFYPLFLQLLGDKHPQRYLILFQNRDEIRPTGGFIGSYLIVDINEGRVVKTQYRDVYETDGQAHREIAPPSYFGKITSRWRLRDANFSPDFPTSAQNILWFLEEEGGPTVDHVIAIDQTVAEKILEVTGPLNSPYLNQKITAENLSLLLSYAVEKKIAPGPTPKQIVFDLIPEIEKKLVEENLFPSLLTNVLSLLPKKHLLFYSRNQEAQDLFSSLGVTEEIYQNQEKEDFLEVVSISLGGNKSDAYVKEKITHITDVTEEGTIQNTLTLTRHHDYNLQTSKKIKEVIGQEVPSWLEKVLGEGINQNFIKVYVPKGSKLVAAKGVPLEDVITTEDLGKTVFAFVSKVSPGKTTRATLIYELPFRLNVNSIDNYRLFVQKQPGKKPPLLIKKISLPQGRKIFQKIPSQQKTVLDTNYRFSSVIGREEI